MPKLVMGCQGQWRAGSNSNYDPNPAKPELNIED
jgi:hypothetical protein